MKTINNSKGFSLIEILVAMTLIGVLSAIAIPSYNNYRKDANATVLKSDIGNGYKAYHTYNAVNGKFCATFTQVGLNALLNSDTYAEKAFVGFKSVGGGCSLSNASDYQHDNSHPFSTGIDNCELQDNSFKLAVGNNYGGDKVGFSVAHNNASPVPNGKCETTGCKTKSECERELKSGTTTCETEAGGTLGTWTDTDLCQ